MLVSKSGQARGLQILTSESRTSLTTSDDIRVSPVIHYHRKTLWKAGDCFSPRLKCRLRSKTRHVLDLHTNSVLLRIAHRRLTSKAAAASKRGRNKQYTGYDFGFTQCSAFLNSSSRKSRERAIQNFELVCSRNAFEADYISSNFDARLLTITVMTSSS